MAPKVLILMADYGHEPTETTIPYTHFKNAGFDVQFATEEGKSPECDRRLSEGIIQKLLGARKRTLDLYAKMKESPECTHPLAWSSPDFSLDAYDLVFFPGGHDKAVRQILDAKPLHAHVAGYFVQCRKPSRKAVLAVCHGVQVIAHCKGKDGKSVLRECDTTALPAKFEQVAFWGTRAFMGDYYKTYGAGSADVEKVVRKALKDPKKQFKSSLGMRPFIVEDENFNYISARFPNDVDLMSEAAVKLVKSFYDTATTAEIADMTETAGTTEAADTAETPSTQTEPTP